MSVPLYAKLYNYVIEEIRSGRLKSGDRLPSEMELAEHFRVSRITSKRAMEELGRAKIIERSRGKGSFIVKDLPPLASIDEALNEAADGDLAAEAAAVQTRTEKTHYKLGLVLPGFSASYGLLLLHAVEDRCADRSNYLLLKRTSGVRLKEDRAIESLVEGG